MFLDIFRYFNFFYIVFSYFPRKILEDFDILRPCLTPPVLPVLQAFARYQLDGEMHVDELKGALVMCPSDLRHWEQLGGKVTGSNWPTALNRMISIYRIHM